MARKERIAVFIDGDNLFGACKSLGWLIDFRKFKEYLERDVDLYNAFYYTSWDEDDKKKNFAIFLTNRGYTVKKRQEQRVRQQGQIVATKGNTDVMMTVDIMSTKSRWDTCILVTGDGDFLPVIDYLRQQGKRIIGISSKEEAASVELVNAVDKFIDLDEIKKEIKRENNGEEK